LLQIEYYDQPRAPGADIAAIELGGERDPVHAGRIGDPAGHRELPGVDDQHVRAVRDEQPVTLGFESQVVPALIARKRYLVSEAITRRGTGACRDGRQEQHACERSEERRVGKECGAGWAAAAERK